VSNASKSESVAWKVRKRVLKSEDRFWHVEDFDVPAMAVLHALGRLVEEGEIERVRRGTYWRGHKTRWSGRSSAPAIAAVREAVGDTVAIGAAGWMAANAVGISTQVVATPIVAVTSRLPTGFENIRLVSRAQRTGRRDAHLTDAEVTLLEALEGWHRYSEVAPDVAVRKFLAFIQTAGVDSRKLVRASATETVTVRERLKALLARAGLVAEAGRINGARTEIARQKALAVIAQQPSAI
jgi:hypothetical protein